MKNEKFIKNIPKNIFIMVVLIFFTFKYLLSGLSKKEFFHAIAISDHKYLYFGIVLSILYIFFEACNTKSILKFFGYSVSIFRAMKYSFTGFFFSGLTPSATGGQPMQVYVMNKDNIKVSHSSLLLMLELCSFQLITIVMCLVGFFLNYEYIFFTKSVDVWIIYFGIISNVIIFLFIFFIIFSKRFVNIVKNICFYTIEKLNFFKDKNKSKDSVLAGLEEYRRSSAFIKNNKKLMIQMLFVGFLQILSLYSISYLVYRAFGFDEFSYIKIVSLQALAYVAVSSMPLPGAIGVSEKIFQFLFCAMYSKKLLAEAMILTRGMNFYLLFLISAIIFFISFGKYIVDHKND